MFTLKVEASFSSAHNLRGYKGKCEALHGHNWKVEVLVRAQELDKTGMVMDFTEIKKHLRAVLEKLDHTYLNKIAYFKKINPTSENISKYIYQRLAARIQGLAAVTVWEISTSCATYNE
jgi:6-pyruvoyltetrahydropterin/6-carboxytetrahydropterin synthase